MRNFFIICLLLAGVITYGQQGCTDPMATNFDKDAIQNDGSCIYNIESLIPETIGTLPDLIKESSGLANWDGSLLSHNDSGDEPVLFLFDKTLENTQTLSFDGLTNVDWESITLDDDYLYIGDFGNNFGIRQDLAIHRIALTDLQNKGPVVSQSFSYARQTDFAFGINSTPFDCESVVSYKDSLLLFSKNWQEDITYIYRVSKTFQSEKISLSPVDSLAIPGLVTDALLFNDSTFVLTSYQRGVVNPHLYIIKNFKGSFSKANLVPVPLNLGEYNQIEAVAKADDQGVYITNENINGTGFLFYINIKNLFSETTSVEKTDSEKIIAETAQVPACGLQPNPVEDKFFVSGDFFGKAVFIAFSGQQIPAEQMNKSFMKVPDSMTSGIYSFVILQDSKIICKEKVFVY